MATAKELITKVYVGYFDRAPDPEGLQYWIDRYNAGFTLSEIAQSFSVQPESVAKYPYLATPSVATSAAFISTVYQNLFNRAPDAEGLAYWQGQLAAGKPVGSFILDVIYGATTNPDAAVVANKVEAGIYWAEKAADTQNFVYTQAAASSAAGVLDGVTDDVASVAAAKVEADGFFGAPGPVVTLTENADNLTANVFDAPRGWTPGGTDQVNTLNTDDVLNGIGVNPTLNFSFVEDADTGITDIAPKLNNIHTVNVDVRLPGSNGILDLQDATGVINAKISGVDDGRTFTLANINTAGGLKTLEIEKSRAPDANVVVSFLDSSLRGAADSLDFTLDDAQLNSVTIQERPGSVDQGYETINLKSTGNANEVGTLIAEDLQSLVISGDQDLYLGHDTLINANEVISRGAGLGNVAGSLTNVDASALEASLEINLSSEVTANVDGKSGVKVDFNVVGSANDDTIRLLNGFDTKGDTIDGGGGNDTLVVYNSVANGKVTNVELLDVRATNAAITVDASLFTGLTGIRVRDENNGASSVTLNKVTSEQANNISIQHGTTGANALNSNPISVNLATQTAADSASITWADQLDGEDRNINSNPRFNQTLILDKIESVTLVDNDTESNTFALRGDAALAQLFELSNTLTLKGGAAGTFLNLDAGTNIYQYATDGSENAATKIVNASADANEYRFSAAKIDATAYLGDVVVRVDTLRDATGTALPGGGQTILLGAGNDTVIFDLINDTTAGLSISDTVKGGEGYDTLVLDGQNVKINISASEWTNVSGIEAIRLVGNNVASDNSAANVNDAYGRNAYNLTLTNDLIANNGAAVTGGRRIEIINDNDLNNEGDNNAGAGGAVRGVTIDARSLNAQSNFSYNGEENANRTADRFIMSDANINGLALINGGYHSFNTASANADILEVRNAAVVTTGDLAGVSNVGTIFFTNDLAATQTSVLQLNDGVVEALVNSSHTAKVGEVETLTVRAFDNPLVAGAFTILNLDASQITSAFLALNVTGGGGADTIIGGAGDDVITASGGADVITLGGGNDVVVYNLATDGGDTITDFNAGTAGTTVDVLRFQDTGFGGATNIGNNNNVVDNFVSGNNAAINAAGVEIGVKTDATVANTAGAVQAVIDGYNNINTGALFVFSDGTNAHVWYDANPSGAGGAVHIATLNGFALAGLANFNATDFQFI